MTDLKVQGSTSFSVRRMTVPAPGVRTFQERYEKAVPDLPLERVQELVAKGAPWSAMVDRIDATVPYTFLIYYREEPRPDKSPLVSA